MSGLSGARLVEVARPRRGRAPVGVVVVLHGGASRRDRPEVSATQLSVLRMVPVARTVARAGRGRLVVARLLNTSRGWDELHSPVADARAALDELAQRWPGVPSALVGHSLGGRAALLAGAHDGVRAVVALNPWVYPDDDVDLTGRRVLVLHGTQDRIASSERSRRVAERIGRRADVTWRDVEGGKHAMLRHGRTFERETATVRRPEPPVGRKW